MGSGVQSLDPPDTMSLEIEELVSEWPQPTAEEGEAQRRLNDVSQGQTLCKW